MLYTLIRRLPNERKKKKKEFRRSIGRPKSAIRFLFRVRRISRAPKVFYQLIFFPLWFWQGSRMETKFLKGMHLVYKHAHERFAMTFRRKCDT